MRGKAVVFNSKTYGLGITPAYAGKSRLCFRGLTRARDHPRVCGEKSPNMPRNLRTTGSPPRMRGKVEYSRLLLRSFRITPAYAGKSPFIGHMQHRGRDHPRVCGEKAARSVQSAFLQGSPPRMRGKVLGAGKGCDDVGITPAYAGKSLFLTRRGFSKWDHPRVCGEKHLFIIPWYLCLGSPPRMRGKD